MSEGQLRLFTAIQLPEAWRMELARLQVTLERSAQGHLKLVRPELMHVTLVFLGGQPGSSLAAIQAACDTAGREANPFTLRLGAPGAFGSPSSLRALWVGLAQPPRELLALHLRLTEELRKRDVNFDAKPLVAHVTLARTRPSANRLVSQQLHSTLTKLSLSRLEDATVEAFELISSDLRPGGPEYSTLAEFPLEGARRTSGRGEPRHTPER